MVSPLTNKAVGVFVQACRQIAERRLVRCSSGNLSMRVAGGRMLVTATRSWLGRAGPDTLAVCRISDGAVLEGGNPSVETGFHAGIMRMRPDVNVVLHFQSACATALACRRDARRVNFNVIPEIPFYIGPVAWVPYHTPGSAALAAAVTRAMRRHDMILLENHGLVTVAADADHAIQNAEFFDLACEIILRAGRELRPLTPAAVRELVQLRKSVSGKV